MMSDSEQLKNHGAEEDDAMAQLLQLAGPRPDAPPERAERVREAVYNAWLSKRRRRTIVRSAIVTTTMLAVAATVVLIVRFGVGSRPAAGPVARAVATGERIEGTPRLSRTVDGRVDVSGFSRDAAVLANDQVETDAASRVSLRTLDDTSVRLDRNSRARLLSATLIELMEGAVYISTAMQSRGFEVRTPLGTVRDRGTQFEVRLVPGDASLRLRVRSGLVEISRGSSVIPAAAGTEATVSASGVDSRAIPTYGTGWDWTENLAPSFDIEGRALSAFLEHVAREQGWTLKYGDADLTTAAERIVLHGSVQGLKPEEAIAVALATSGLQYHLRNGELVVFRPAPAR
jgi:hypothetical protein